MRTPAVVITLALLAACGSTTHSARGRATTTTTEPSGGEPVATTTTTGEPGTPATPEPPAPPPVDCHPSDRPGDGPNHVLFKSVPAADYANRTGAKATSFASLPTSPRRPLEGCGHDQIMATLTTLTCEDGSNPFGGEPARAFEARVGSLDQLGGRCRSPIDLYRIQCPDASYQVYADMYYCPRE